jgi:hypothetical protein
LIESGSARKYLLYAIGEIALVVIGITLALMANSWYQSHQEYKYERYILRQLQMSLAADLNNFEQNYKILNQSERDLDKLLGSIRSAQIDPGEADSLYYAVRLWKGNVRMRKAVYEETKNHGFALISNISIRTQIVDIYEDLQPALMGATSVDAEFSKEQVLPYYRSKFKSITEDIHLPFDVESVLGDPLYENLIIEKLTRLRNRLLPQYEALIAAIDQVCDQIDVELSN